MKRYLLFLCGLLLAACSSEFEEEAGAVRGGRAVELTGVSGSSTRTSAGAVDGAAIPFLWSADDRIWVNGVQSSEAGTAGAAASFGFSELTGEAPYEVYYNMTGEGARAVVPSRQNQAAAGELQLGANGDFGYATTDAGGHFTLSHATSYIWFDPWSQEVDARLVSVSLATADRTIALCGTRTFDGGGFGAATGGEYAVTLSFGAEGVALPASGGDTRVFAAAVVYPVDCSATEVHVTYTFADGSVYTETRPGRKLEAGATYRLTSEITKRAGGALEIEAGEADGEPVCLKYGGSEVRSLTAEGWIPQVRTTAPARWTADLNIARRTLRVAPPAEYLEGQDLENTLRIESDGEPLFSQDYYVLDFTHPEGTFVLMEGNMTTENGSIVYFDQHMRCHERVYEEVNDNEIGNVLQDMYMIGGRIYFITQNGRTSSTGTTLNGDGRFVICDAHTMKRILARDMPFYAQVASSSGVKPTLCWPQHIVAVSPEKGYIQYSTSDMESHSGIRTVNLVSGVIATTDIPDTYGVFTKTGATKARMTVSRGKVFAGRGNSVIVIDSATDRVVREHTYPDRQVKDLAKGARREDLRRLHRRVRDRRRLGLLRQRRLEIARDDRGVRRRRRGRLGADAARDGEAAHRHGFAERPALRQLPAAVALLHRQERFQCDRGDALQLRNGAGRLGLYHGRHRRQPRGRFAHLRLHGRAPHDRAVVGGEILLYEQPDPPLRRFAQRCGGVRQLLSEKGESGGRRFRLPLHGGVDQPIGI